MRSKLRLTKLLSLVIFALMLIGQISFASSSQPNVILNNIFDLNRYGFVLVNTTLTITNTQGKEMQLPDTLELSYSGDIYNHLAGFTVIGVNKNLVEVSKVENYTLYKIKLGGKLKQNEERKITLIQSLKLYVRPTGKLDKFEMNITTIPGVNLNLSKVESSFIIPKKLVVEGIPIEFKRMSEGNREVLKATYENISSRLPQVYNLTVQANPPSSELYVIKVSKAVREIEVGENGEVFVHEKLSLTNLGTTVLSKIRLNYLVKDLASIIVEPTGDPPERNSFEAILIEGMIELSSGDFLDKSIERNEIFALHIKYKANELVSTDNGIVKLKIPNKLPIDTIIDNYVLKLKLPKGFVAIDYEPLIIKNASKVNELEKEEIVYSYKISPAWAAEDAFPIATFIFLACFAFIYAFRFRGEEEKKVEKVIIELSRAYEDKVETTNSVILDLIGREFEGVSRRKLNEVRRRVEEIRSSTSAKITELSLSKLRASDEVRKLVSLVTTADKDFDKAVRDLIHLFDMYLSKRVKQDVVQKLLKEQRKRLQNISSNFLERLRLLRREARL